MNFFRLSLRKHLHPIVVLLQHPRLEHVLLEVLLAQWTLDAVDHVPQGDARNEDAPALETTLPWSSDD